jgi:signal transduction histidine kinase
VAERSVWRSVRFRITALAAAALIVVLSGAGLAVLRLQQRELLRNLDRSLATRAEALATLDVDAAGAGGPLELANDAGAEVVVQIVSNDSVVVAGTANALELDPIGPTGPAAGDLGSDSLRTVSDLPIEDDRYRILSRRLDSGRTLHVAENIDDLDNLLAELRFGLVLTGVVSVTLLSAGVWWLVGRTLRPVDAIRAEVASISGGPVDRRVPVPNTGDEVALLASTMNEMLGRLHDAGERQRRFVADASHELRSPLARMRAELETATDDPAARASAIEEIDAMSTLVDDLLVLARVDSGEFRVHGRPTDLDDIVLDEVRRSRELLEPDDTCAIDASGVSAAHVVGDPAQLRRVVRNVLDNAVRHAASRVVVELAELSRDDAPDRARLVVTDDGPGIPPEFAEVVFERFARLDEARSTGSGGVGLGLAIAREIIERHAGSIRVDTTYRRGSRLVVELPAG